MLLRQLARGTAAVALVAAAAVLPAPSASAATCSSGSGVSVVVDFHELGGGVQTACVGDGGGDAASSLFPAAGFPLSYVQRQPGFVCRVSGAPSDSPCVNTPPADAYWGLFWSDGESGSWSYATTGVGSLHVPDGGYVALSWQGSSSRALPGVAPSPHPSIPPTPTQQQSGPSTGRPTRHPSGHATTGTTSVPSTTEATSASPTASVSATAGTGHHRRPHHGGSSAPPTATAATDPSESPSASADDAVPASSEATDPDDGGLPGWVGPVVVVLLFGGVGAVAVVRRRRGPA